jgi:hypothetical protein
MSIIKSLLESETAIIDNNMVTSVIEELADIQEQGSFLPKDVVQYTTESAPVFKTIQGSKELYVVECDNMFKLMKDQDTDEIQAFKNLKSVLSSDDKEVKFDDMALLVKDEDIEQIQEAYMSDKSKYNLYCEQIMTYNTFLKNVKSLGVNLLIDK